MHLIYNWLLNKHICIIILERLFAYQIKSTCNKTKLILLSYWVSSACIYYRSNYLHRNKYLIEVMDCLNRMFIKTNTHIWKYLVHALISPTIQYILSG
jgi:hypothetical protein